jgi:hypothetical protein
MKSYCWKGGQPGVEILDIPEGVDALDAGWLASSVSGWASVFIATTNLQLARDRLLLSAAWIVYESEVEKVLVCGLNILRTCPVA